MPSIVTCLEGSACLYSWRPSQHSMCRRCRYYCSPAEDRRRSRDSPNHPTLPPAAICLKSGGRWRGRRRQRAPPCRARRQSSSCCSPQGRHSRRPLRRRRLPLCTSKIGLRKERPSAPCSSCLVCVSIVSVFFCIKSSTWYATSPAKWRTVKARSSLALLIERDEELALHLLRDALGEMHLMYL